MPKMRLLRDPHPASGHDRLRRLKSRGSRSPVDKKRGCASVCCSEVSSVLLRSVISPEGGEGLPLHVLVVNLDNHVVDADHARSVRRAPLYNVGHVHPARRWLLLEEDADPRHFCTGWQAGCVRSKVRQSKRHEPEKETRGENQRLKGREGRRGGWIRGGYHEGRGKRENDGEEAKMRGGKGKGGGERSGEAGKGRMCNKR